MIHPEDAPPLKGKVIKFTWLEGVLVRRDYDPKPHHLCFLFPKHSSYEEGKTIVSNWKIIGTRNEGRE